MSGGSKITGSKTTNFESFFTRVANCVTLKPSVFYSFKHMDDEKTNAILNRMVRGEITFDEMKKLLKEEMDRILPPDDNELKYIEEDEDEDEDDSDEDGGEIRKALRLLRRGQEKPGIVKRPLSSLVESELECKKPRLAEGLGCQGGEPEAAEM